MSQISMIQDKLNKDGYVDTDWAHSMFIGRLAARINDLNGYGYNIITEKKEKKNRKPDGSKAYNYIYKAVI